MASERVIARQTAVREELDQRIFLVSQPDFIRRYVYDLMPEYRGGRGDANQCRVSIVQNDGTGAATIEYTTEHKVKAFAKLYASNGAGAAFGEHSYNVLKALWNNGCGADSRYRVSEPLGFFPDYKMLLIRGADGRLVASAKTDAELAAGSREAERWLVNLHKTSVRIGEIRYPWEVYHKLMHRLAKAAAQHPQMVDDLIEMSDHFEELAGKVKLQLVQAHGQYRHIHVFVSQESVTVIDLDRSRPSDPAKDLGEFIHRMRAKMFKATNGANRAEEATDAFIQEYGSRLPKNLANLPYYWGYHTLVSLWRFMKSSTPEDPKWNMLIDFYKSEFEKAALARQIG
jgi:hypothetical protein